MVAGEWAFQVVTAAVVVVDVCAGVRPRVCHRWPSEYVPNLINSLVYARLHYISQKLYGADMAFDFDMIISKAAHTDTTVPWHQGGHSPLPSTRLAHCTCRCSV